MSFFNELKRRNVVRVGLAYGIAGWVLLQVADLVLENIEAPSWVIQTLMLFVLLGFIAAVIIAWAYEITPEGIKKESEVDRSQSISGHTGKKLDRIIIGFLVLAVAVLLIDRSMTPEMVPVSSPGVDIVSVDPSGQPSATISTPQTSDQETNRSNSIAVLPFANRSMQQEDLFFTDGIHDDLLTQLAKVNGLKVISRTSVMKYRDTQKSIPEIAAELGVSQILEGGIQRAGKRIRINAQLIDVSNDLHLWAETFDREMTMENIFDIQSEITRQIVTAVRGELTDEEAAGLSQLPTKNLAAYEAYLQGMALIHQADYDQANYIEAEFWLNKALKLDPVYAQAWAAMVEVHGQAIWIGYDSNPERFEAAREAVENASRYGPGLSETLAAEGEYLYRIKNDYVAAVAKLQQAKQLAPGNSHILERLAVAQRRAGLFDESISNFKKAMELDPGNSRSAVLLTDTLINVKRFEEALPLLDQWLTKFPEARDLIGQRARLYMYFQGDLPSARDLMNSVPPWSSAEYFAAITVLPVLERDYQGVIDTYAMAEVRNLLPNRGYLGFEGWQRGFAYRMLGDEQAAIEQLDAAISLVTNAQPSGTSTDAFELANLAQAHAGKGMYTEALAEIDQSIEIMQRGGDAIFGPEQEKIRAQILAMSGNRDEALAEIKRLLNNPVGFSRWELYLSPYWDFFRDDERFNELARPLNLDEAQR